MSGRKILRRSTLRPTRHELRSAVEPSARHHAGSTQTRHATGDVKCPAITKAAQSAGPRRSIFRPSRSFRRISATVDQHCHGIEITGVTLQSELLRFQRQRAAAREGVVEGGKLVSIEKLFCPKMVDILGAGRAPALPDFRARSRADYRATTRHVATPASSRKLPKVDASVAFLVATPSFSVAPRRRQGLTIESRL